MTVIGEKLWVERGDGAPIGHRVVEIGKPFKGTHFGKRTTLVDVCLIDTGARTAAPMSELVPAAPLTAAEEAEYLELDMQLAGTIGDARKLRRFNGLRLRSLLFGGEPA